MITARSESATDPSANFGRTPFPSFPAPGLARSQPKRPRRVSHRRDPQPLKVPGLESPTEVKIASEHQEFEQAFQLISTRYRARGYEEPSPKLFRFTPYHALPETLTVVARRAGQVIATLSLVPDNRPLGLPMEGIYGAEIDALRRDGRRLAEATSLADRDLAPSEFLRVFLTMIKLVMQVHLRRGGDSWVITVNPRHAGFYRRVLGFRRLGERRAYAAVQNHPAEAYLLDVSSLRTKAPAMYDELLGEPLPDEVLTAPRRPHSHARYFGARSTLADRQTIENLIRTLEIEGSSGFWHDEPGPTAWKSDAHPARPATPTMAACG